MAGFCSNCGFPLGANSSFCPQCGTRQAAGSAAAPPQTPAAAVSAPSSGSGLKILLAVFIFLGVAGMAVIGGVWYVAHRVKQAVVKTAQENGVDLGSIVPPTHTSSNRHRTHKACELLSQAEAASMLGEPIERMESRDAECLYFGPSGLAAKLASDQAAEVYQRAQAPGGHVESPGDGDGRGATGGQPGRRRRRWERSEMPLLNTTVEEDGRGAMMGLNATAALASGIAHAADPEEKRGRQRPDQGPRGPRRCCCRNSGCTSFKPTRWWDCLPDPCPVRSQNNCHRPAGDQEALKG